MVDLIMASQILEKTLEKVVALQKIIKYKSNVFLNQVHIILTFFLEEGGSCITDENGLVSLKSQSYSLNIGLIDTLQRMTEKNVYRESQID